MQHMGDLIVMIKASSRTLLVEAWHCRTHTKGPSEDTLTAPNHRRDSKACGAGWRERQGYGLWRTMRAGATRAAAAPRPCRPSCRRPCRARPCARSRGWARAAPAPPTCARTHTGVIQCSGKFTVKKPRPSCRCQATPAFRRRHGVALLNHKLNDKQPTPTSPFVPA